MKFLAIDFETANEDRATACALGWALVIDGSISGSDWTLLDPEIGRSEWSAFNTSVHGLTARDVAGAPTFLDFWPALREIVGEGPVVAHYAAFDMSVLTRRAAALRGRASSDGVRVLGPPCPRSMARPT